MDCSRPASKKSLGQRFLVSDSVANRIVGALSPVRGELVFEIGPGRGALTFPLADRGAEVVAYEIDSSLAELLEERCSGRKNIEIINADIRDVDLDAAAAERDRKHYKIVGNIPYHLTSTILLDLPRWKGSGSNVLMVQREVGERINSKPGDRNCGILTIFLRSYFDIATVMRVRPGSFSPRPKVESVVLRFSVKESEGAPSDREGFLAFLKLAFSQRRKKLRTALRGSAGMIDAKMVLRLAELSGVDMNLRPEELELEAWFELFGRFEEIKERR